MAGQLFRMVPDCTLKDISRRLNKGCRCFLTVPFRDLRLHQAGCVDETGDVTQKNAAMIEEVTASAHGLSREMESLPA